MIHSFKASNFYSINDEVEISLLSSGNVHSPERFFVRKNKRISKALFIGGANGSGKTNILRVLSFIRFMVCDSTRADNVVSGPLAFNKFINSDEDTNLSVTFSFDSDNVYTYFISLSTDRIKKERLSVDRKVTTRNSEKYIFERVWCDKTESYELKCNYEYLPNFKLLNGSKERLNSAPKSSLICLFYMFDDMNGVLRRVYKYWLGCFSNVIFNGNLETKMDLAQWSRAALKDIHKNEYLNSKMSEILLRYDIGFKNIADIKVLTDSGEEISECGLVHSFKDKTFALSMNDESTGTQRIITLMQGILSALGTENGVAIMDEMDAYLHPFIFEDIVNMFMSSEINTNNSQLIFSSQYYSIMNKLDKQQIILTEKNEYGETEAWRLDKMEGAGVRADDNFYAKYLINAYGGVPEVY